MTFAAFADLARTLVVRAFTADFQRERATGRERAELLGAERPVADPLAQDYVSWRRAALWVAAVLLSLGVVLSMLDSRRRHRSLRKGPTRRPPRSSRCSARATCH